jgi:DNA-binding GntR family transcriptional regulator
MVNRNARGSNLKDRVYDNLKERILAHELASGDVLLEVEVARDLGVSRTPVREALRLLEREGLVTISAGRGAFVSSPSWKELDEICVIREVVEALATRLAAHFLPEKELQRLEHLLDNARKDLAEGNYQAVLAADAIFHDTLNHYCGNNKLIGIIEVLTNQTRLNELRILTAHLPGHLEQSLREHHELLEALCAHDGDRAEQVMRDHGHRFFTEGLRHWGTKFPNGQQPSEAAKEQGGVTQ